MFEILFLGVGFAVIVAAILVFRAARRAANDPEAKPGQGNANMVHRTMARAARFRNTRRR